MQTSWKAKVLITIATYFVSFSYAAEPFNMQIVVGNYDSTDRRYELPLLAISRDHGATWSYPTDIISDKKLPLAWLDYKFTSAICPDDFCIAMGDYVSSIYNHPPLVAVSENKGTSWSYVSTMPPNIGELYIHEQVISCHTTSCVIARSYKNMPEEYEENELKHLISFSKDKGKSWSYSTISSPAPLKNVRLMGLDCTNEYCIAAGRAEGKPMIAVSKDQGASWSYSKLDLPIDYQSASFRAVKCKNSICIAVGDYNKPNTQADVIVLKSIDKGNSWSMIKTDYQPFSRYVDLRSITYSGDTWIITGMDLSLRQDQTPAFKPLVFVSQDNGSNWIQPPTLISKLLPKLEEDHFTLSAATSCIDDLCVMPILGRYTNTYALALSQDRGITWSYLDVTPTESISSYEGRFGPMSCGEKSCFVAGSYYDVDKKNKNFVIVSNDKGATWYLPPTISSGVPTNFVQGRFYSSAQTDFQASSF